MGQIIFIKGRKPVVAPLNGFPVSLARFISHHGGSQREQNQQDAQATVHFLPEY